MSSVDQLVMVASIKGGSSVRQGDAAFLDIADNTGRIIRLAVQYLDLPKLESAFGELQAMVATERQQAGKDVGIETVTALTIANIVARADPSNGAVVLQFVHEGSSRSSYVTLTLDQCDELARRLDAAKADLAAYRSPN